MGRSERRLTAIMAADVAGYTRMLALDEPATLEMFRAAVTELLTPLVAEHGGRIVKTMGDGALVEFVSTIAAIECAAAFQRGMATRNRGLATPMVFRVAVNVGDAVLEGGDVFGDVVALTTRIEKLAKPGGVCVTARVREDARGHAAFQFEDGGEHRLKNIDNPVRVFHLREASLERPPLSLPDRPSIAVLPFQNMSGDAAQEYFADAVSEDIISGLSRWRWFFVIARNSSFIYKGRAVDVTQVGRELGVRYVLEGSVRRTPGAVRVVAQLIEAESGAHIWSDTFDGDVPNLFALYDQITEHVVKAIEPAMLQSEGARVAQRNVSDLSAFDCFQRGMWRLHQVSREAADDAMDLFQQAIRRDPQLSLAYTGLARILYGKVVYGWSQDSERDLNDSYAAARKSIDLDPRDSWAHFALSGPLLFLGRHDEALSAAETTIALNPNCALGQSRLGQALVYAGRAKEALAPLDRSLRHNPYDPQIGGFYLLLALANYHAGNYEDAARHAQAAVTHNDVRASGLHGASLARLGRIEEARRAFSPEIQQRTSLAVRRMIPYARPQDFLDLVEGLRLAGLGEPLLATLPERLEREAPLA
jgi:adenylate cyclase